MKNISIMATIIAVILFSGCALKSYNAGLIRDSYNPKFVNGATKEKGAFIKSASGMAIISIDRERQISIIDSIFAGGLDSVIVTEGEHTILASRKRDINFGSVMYKSGHTYLLNYFEVQEGDSSNIYYWVEDLTDNKVVYGKKVSKKDFVKDEK